jgi:2-iminobutanoate/2-iminopropanoate deaminase
MQKVRPACEVTGDLEQDSSCDSGRFEGKEEAMSVFEIVDPWNLGDRYTFSTAVKRGNLLFISGMIARDPSTGRIAGKGDIALQADFIFRRMGEILKAAGGSYDDVVKTTDYVTTLEGYRATAEIRRRYFTKGFPAATGVVVKSLVNADALIEIDAIAVVDP